jgi:hypothetical protein
MFLSHPVNVFLFLLISIPPLFIHLSISIYPTYLSISIPPTPIYISIHLCTDGSPAEEDVRAGLQQRGPQTLPALRAHAGMYVCVCMYIYVCMCVCMYVYIFMYIINPHFIVYNVSLYIIITPIYY